MTQEILTAAVWMEDDGRYKLQVVDHLGDTTMESTLPDQYVGMLPMVISEIRRKLGG